MRIALRILLVLLAIAGIVTSAKALRVHYQDPSEAPPCAVTEKWDCGTVNHSRYSIFPAAEIGDDPMHSGGIPVALLGEIGYTVMAVLAVLGLYRLLLLATLGGLAFALHLSYIEDKVIEKWCIYCVTSQGIIAVMFVLAIIAVVLNRKRPITPAVAP